MNPKHETIKPVSASEASAKAKEDLNASTARLVAASAAIPTEHPRRLHNGPSVKKAFVGTVETEGFTHRETANTTEGLTHFLIVGDSVLGISRVTNKKRGLGDQLETIRLSKLPLGEQGDKTGVSLTLAEVDVRALKRPGTMQPWKTVSIGRQDLAGRQDEDSTVSGSHFDFTVRSDGRFGILDHSTNGTTILSAEEYSQTLGALDEGGRTDLINVAQALQEDPTMWQTSTANSASSPVTIINPN